MGKHVGKCWLKSKWIGCFCAVNCECSMFWLFPDATLKVGFWSPKLVMIREHHSSLRLKDFDFMKMWFSGKVACNWQLGGNPSIKAIFYYLCACIVCMVLHVRTWFLPGIPNPNIIMILQVATAISSPGCPTLNRTKHKESQHDRRANYRYLS